MSKFQVANDFIDGFASCLRQVPRYQSESRHWRAGWDAGYSLKNELHLRLNDYLYSIDIETIATIHLSANGERTVECPPE